jgi:predicted nucleic acid-binding protein
MKKLKLYLDTSTVSHLDQQDTPDKMADTLTLWQEIEDGIYDVYLSFVLFEEVLECSPKKRRTLAEFISRIDYTHIEADNEIALLADEFIKQDILRPKSYDDAQHLASAMVSECDIIVSWNFKHMVNLRTINGVKVVAALTGYKDIAIYTPSILIGGTDDDT